MDFSTTSRRTFLAAALGALALPRITTASERTIASRIRGMLLGSLIGDAAGGPLEFKTRDELQAPPISFRKWGADESIDSQTLARLASEFMLRPYDGIRPEPHPYGPWRWNAPAGTVTDDSRFKAMVISMLRDAQRNDAFPIGADAFAKALINYYDDPHSPARELNREWLHEFAMAARWKLGERDTNIALPPSRLWGGIPTVTGQMALLPVAALFPGKPNAAYTAAYELAFLDNGSGKDITAALVAGLSAALNVDDPRAAWDAATDAMVNTDPYRFGEVPWLERSVNHWINFARTVARDAQGGPARLFALLEDGLQAKTYWEAHVPLACIIAVMEFCDGNPLAAMELILEFGHDTDSNAQLLGAFIGATHGEDIFPESMRELVTTRLREDYAESVDDWVETLSAVENGYEQIVTTR